MQPLKNLGDKILGGIVDVGRPVVGGIVDVGRPVGRKISAGFNYLGKKITFLFPKDIQNNNSANKTSQKGLEFLPFDGNSSTSSNSPIYESRFKVSGVGNSVNGSLSPPLSGKPTGAQAVGEAKEAIPTAMIRRLIDYEKGQLQSVISRLTDECSKLTPAQKREKIEKLRLIKIVQGTIENLDKIDISSKITGEEFMQQLVNDAYVASKKAIKKQEQTSDQSGASAVSSVGEGAEPSSLLSQSRIEANPVEASQSLKEALKSLDDLLPDDLEALLDPLKKLKDEESGKPTDDQQKLEDILASNPKVRKLPDNEPTVDEVLKSLNSPTIEDEKATEEGEKPTNGQTTTDQRVTNLFNQITNNTTRLP